MGKGKQWVLACIIRFNRKKNCPGTDRGLNIPDGLNTEVLCGGKIDP